MKQQAEFDLAKNKLYAIYRSHYSSFIERSFLELNPETEYQANWHIDVLADALEKCRTGKIRRLIINLPPRSLKSHCVTVAFSAWLLGHNPSEKIICVSYAQDLANKLALDAKSLMQSQFYRDTFKTRLSPMKQAVDEFMTTKGGCRFASSVGGVLTGIGANFIIIDDPMKPFDAFSEAQRNSVNEWFSHTLVSRLNSKVTGCIILVMQRLHEDDLVGHVQQFGEWKVISFPGIAESEETHHYQDPFDQNQEHIRRAGEALHEDREPLEVLQSLREAMGEYDFSAQYQQSPMPRKGGIVQLDWFKTYTDGEQPEVFDLTFQSWDTANKASELSDYSVCTTWGKKGTNLYLRHVFRKRLEYPELKRAVLRQAEEFSAKNVLIEDKASGTQLIQELKADGLHGISGYSSSLDKVMRMRSTTSTIENGFVFLPANASWLDAYRHELATFPKGKYDDQVDSTSQALDWIKGHGKEKEYGYLGYMRNKEKENPCIYPLDRSFVYKMRR